ncbi:hypothetical protein E5U26_33385 [Burkholderia pseudomallei]|nr:hypothetical protein [Burkholderia pseudomallei]
MRGSRRARHARRAVSPASPRSIRSAARGAQPPLHRIAPPSTGARRFGPLRPASGRFAPLRTASGHDACVFGAFARLLLSCRLEYSEPGASPCFRQASASISRQRCAT